MNGAFLHLAVNHIHVIAMPMAALLLVASLIWKSRDLAAAGFVTLIVLGLGIYPVLKTGGKAAGMVHDLPGIAHETIHAHAHEADETLWPTMVLGVLALMGLVVLKRSNDVPKGLVVLALLGALWMSMWFCWVAHLGGLIRHPEIAKDFVAPAQPDADDN